MMIRKAVSIHLRRNHRPDEPGATAMNDRMIVAIADVFAQAVSGRQETAGAHGYGALASIGSLFRVIDRSGAAVGTDSHTALVPINDAISDERPR